MSMNAKLEQLLADPAPGFICRAAGKRGKEPGLKFLARVTHQPGKASSPEDLAMLRKMMAVGSEQLLSFYAEHDGLDLYTDTIGDAVGVRLHPIADMDAAGRDMKEWLTTFDDEDDTNGLKSACAIGEVPHSGNFFAMPVTGRLAGKVFYVNHDDWHEEPFAESFNDFVERISSSPAQLLSHELGCYARYSDGKTDIQWIPEEYLTDVSTSKIENKNSN